MRSSGAEASRDRPSSEAGVLLSDFLCAQLVLCSPCFSVAHPRLGPLRALLQRDDPGSGNQGWRGRSKIEKNRIKYWAGEMEICSGPCKLWSLSLTVNCPPITGLTETDTQPYGTIKRSQASRGGKEAVGLLKMLGGNFLMSPPP